MEDLKRHLRSLDAEIDHRYERIRELNQEIEQLNNQKKLAKQARANELSRFAVGQLVIATFYSRSKPKQARVASYELLDSGQMRYYLKDLNGRRIPYDEVDDIQPA